MNGRLADRNGVQQYQINALFEDSIGLLPLGVPESLAAQV